MEGFVTTTTPSAQTTPPMKSPTRSSRTRRNAAGAELAAALLAFAVLPLAAEEPAAAPAHADTAPAHSATAVVNEADGLFQKALAARKAGKTDEALDCLEKATELAPDRTDVLFELGTLAGELSGPRSSIPLAFKAKGSLERVLELAPTHTGAREWLIGFYSGAPWFVGGSMKKAYHHAEVLATQDAGKGFYWTHRLYMQDKRYDDAFALCDAALVQQPQNLFASYQLGVTSAESGQRLADGRTALEACLAASVPYLPGPDILCLHLGRILEKQDDNAGAIARYEEGLKANAANKDLADRLAKLR